jgi:hypothetical protein
LNLPRGAAQARRSNHHAVITLEEHFATPRFFDGPGRDLKDHAEKFNNARALKPIPQLCDLGDDRIAEMDAAGIDMQIVSLTAPGVEQLEAAQIALTAETNDFVADAIVLLCHTAQAKRPLCARSCPMRQVAFDLT